MSASDTVVIVNPNSRGGALGRQWPDVAVALRRKLGSFEERMTEQPGDATRLTRTAIRSGARRIVALGGDGTINEVCNGFFDGGKPIADDAALGVLPYGSGGDFRKTIAVPRDLDDAAYRLASSRPRKVDVGLVDFVGNDGEESRRYFINIASFGLSGLVDRYVNQSSKKLGGTLSFLAASARAGLEYSNQRVRLYFDDGEPIDTIIQLCAIANGRYFGGGMYIAPEARLDDGLFDVVAVGDMSRADLVLSGYRIYKGTHLTHEKVSHRRASKVRAEPLDNSDVLLDIDGEAPGRLPATFSIQPASLSILVA